MKKLLIIGLATLSCIASYAQESSLEAQYSIDSLLPSTTTKSITSGRLRFAFTKVLRYFKTNTPVTPEEFGAKGDGITNDAPYLAAMFNATKKGEIRFTRGKTYKVSGTVQIVGYGNETSNLIITGYGAKIITDNPVTTPVILFNNCMRMSIKGLEIDGTVDYDGWYFGSMEDCYLKRLRFGNQNLDNIDETYWSVWKRCKIANGIYIHTGTAGDRTEFNANSFYDCNIWYDTHAFHVYGDQTAQNCNFFSCDISYQTVGRMEVEQPVLDAQFNFYSCYFDDNFDVPVNSKNVVINTYGFGNNPNSGNVGQNATTPTGSQNDVSSSYGGRTGSRVPYSPYNLIINGDLCSGKASINTDWGTVTNPTGSGAFGKYLRFVDNSSSQKSIEFTSIPAPYTGMYAVTVIGRNVGNTALVFGNVVNNVDGLYNPVAVNDQTDFVVSTGKVYLQQGQVYKFRVFSQANVTNTLDIAYVGLSFGRTGGLMAVQHPMAATVKTATAYFDGSNANTVFTLPVAVNERVSAKCTCYGADPTYPDGSTYQEMVILANRNDSVFQYSLTPVTNYKVGDMSAAPTFALTENAGVLTLTATPAAGLIRLNCELKGIFR